MAHRVKHEGRRSYAHDLREGSSEDDYELGVGIPSRSVDGRRHGSGGSEERDDGRDGASQMDRVGCKRVVQESSRKHAIQCGTSSKPAVE